MAELEEFKQIERSIIKRFRKEIFGPFVRAIKTYEMIQPNDKIAVCISGGKDSMLLAKCMQEILRHGQMQFELVFLVMNPGYNDVNYKKIQENAKKLNVPITVFETQKVYRRANSSDLRVLSLNRVPSNSQCLK